MARKSDETVALSCKLPEHELEAEKKRLTSAMGDQIDGTKTRIRKLNLETETGSGIRSVICKWSIERSKDAREWVLRRSDTGEAVRVEPLTAVDSQEEMFS